jgi:hypothetical protein
MGDSSNSPHVMETGVHYRIQKRSQPVPFHILRHTEGAVQVLDSVKRLVVSWAVGSNLPNPEPEDHPLSVARDSLLNILAAAFHIAGRS